MVVVALVVLLAHVIPAHTQPFTTYRHSVQRFTEAEGLPSSQINDLGQDGPGVIWAATTRGIVGFDGELWFAPDLPMPEQARPNVRRVATDASGRLWAVGNHLELWRQQSDDRFELLGPPDATVERDGAQITGLAVQATDSGHRVLVGTSTRGLQVWRGDRFAELIPAKGLCPLTIKQMTVSRDTVYVTTSHGIGRISPNGHYDFRPMSAWGLPDQPPLLLVAETRPTLYPDRLWLVLDEQIGYLESGLGSPFTPVIDTPPLPGMGVIHGPVGTADGAGGLIFGSADLDYRLTPCGELHTLGTPSGMLATGITTIFRDRETSIWSGSYRGISKIRSLLFESVNRELGLLEDEVTALCQGPDGSMVVGHNRGISIVEDGEVRHLSFAQASLDSYTRVMDIDLGPDGRTWIAASHLGFGRLGPDDTIEWFVPPTQGRPHTATSIAFDTTAGPTIEDQIALLTFRNLWRLQDGALVKVDTPEPIRSGRRMIADPEGGFWYSDPDHVAVRWMDGTFTTRHRDGIQQGNASAFSLVPYRGSGLLAGTSTGILGLFGDHFVPFLPGGNPIDRPVYMLMSTEQGELWIGTDHGLLQWDGKEIHPYTIHEGVAGFEINRDAALIDTSGAFWVGTNAGLSRFNRVYADPRLAPAPPQLSIRHVIASGDTLSPEGEISIPHGRDLTISYRAISHTNNGRVTYKTMLRRHGQIEGIEIRTTARQMHYPNLRPGRYEFIVVATNERDAVSAAARIDALRVELPLYQQPVFLVILVAVLAGIVLLGVQYVVARRTAVRLERLVEERTAQLRAQSEAHRSLVENAVFGILRVDTQGSIITANRALGRLLACESEERLLRRSVRDDIAHRPEDWDQLMAQSPERRRFDGHTMRWIRCDGEPITVRLSGRFTRDDSGEAIAELFVEDITEQLRARESQLEAERLRGVQKLAITVAHEFNNPLSILLGTYQLYLQSRLGDFDDDTRTRIERIPVMVERMKSLVNRLLRITRLKEEEYISGTNFLNLSESTSEDGEWAEPNAPHDAPGGNGDGAAASSEDDAESRSASERSPSPSDPGTPSPPR